MIDTDKEQRYGILFSEIIYSFCKVFTLNRYLLSVYYCAICALMVLNFYIAYCLWDFSTKLLTVLWKSLPKHCSSLSLLLFVDLLHLSLIRKFFAISQIKSNLMRLSQTPLFTICSFRNLPNGKDKESECVVDVLDGKGLPDSLLFQETANLIRRMVHRCPHCRALNYKNRY